MRCAASPALGPATTSGSAPADLAGPPMVAITPSTTIGCTGSSGGTSRSRWRSRSATRSATPSSRPRISWPRSGTDLADQVVDARRPLATPGTPPNASDNTIGGRRGPRGDARILKALDPPASHYRAGGALERRGTRLFGSRAYVRKHRRSARLHVAHQPEFQRLSAYFNQDYGAGQYRGSTCWRRSGAGPAHRLDVAVPRPRDDDGQQSERGSTDHVAFDEVGLRDSSSCSSDVPGTGGTPTSTSSSRSRRRT